MISLWTCYDARTNKTMKRAPDAACGRDRGRADAPAGACASWDILERIDRTTLTNSYGKHRVYTPKQNTSHYAAVITTQRQADAAPTLIKQNERSVFFDSRRVYSLKKPIWNVIQIK